MEVVTKILLLCFALYIPFYCFKKRKPANLTDDGTSSRWLPSMRISTNIFNNTLQQFGRRYKALCRFWFTLGAACSIIGVVPVVYLFISTCVSLLSQLFAAEQTDGVRLEVPLEPVLPGVNVHGNDILHYVAAIFISSAVHELGHAVAATSEYLTIHCTGFLLVLIFPAAFVDLPSSDLNLLPILSQIRIFTAGVWHNIVLSLFAWLALISLPTLLSPVFQTGNGVLVVDITKDSPLLGGSGIEIMDVVHFVDGCEVSDEKSWRTCLLQTLKEESPGFCTDINITEKAGRLNLDSITSEECCHNGTESSVCFRSTVFAVCLPARTVVKHSAICLDKTCTADSTCLIPWTEAKNSSLPRLVVIKTLSAKEVLFLGHPGEIYSTLKVSSYVTDMAFLVSFPRVLYKFLLYLCSISAGLACVNLVPCIGLDGFHLSKICIFTLLRQRCYPQSIENVHRIVTLIGTLLIFVTVMLSFIHFFI